MIIEEVSVSSKLIRAFSFFLHNIYRSNISLMKWRILYGTPTSMGDDDPTASLMERSQPLNWSLITFFFSPTSICLVASIIFPPLLSTLLFTSSMILFIFLNISRCISKATTTLHPWAFTKSKPLALLYVGFVGSVCSRPKFPPWQTTGRLIREATRMEFTPIISQC